MSKLIRKLFAIATSLTVMAMMVGVSPAKALTAEELQAQINDLLATLAALQSQLSELEGGTTPTTPSGTVPTACTGISFTRALKQGMSGSDVKCLQALLNTDADTKLASSGAGSPKCLRIRHWARNAWGSITTMKRQVSGRTSSPACRWWSH